MSGSIRVTYHVDGFKDAINTALSEVEAVSFSKRLWAKDSSLWKKDNAHRQVIDNSLGWLSAPANMAEHLAELDEFSMDIRRRGFKDVVLLGMGGSSLAPYVFSSIFQKKEGSPNLRVLDTTDPVAITNTECAIDIEDTLFIVASKSGSTIEPLSLFEYFYSTLSARVGSNAGENFIAITDPGSGLEKMASEKGFLRVFRNQADIGGRYSALSHFGLVPAALFSVELKKLLDDTLEMIALCSEDKEGEANMAVKLGSVLGGLWKSGRDKLTFVIDEKFSSFGLWIEQLVAESTGKEGVGLVPITGEPLLGPSSYSDDRVFINIRQKGGKVSKELIELKEAGHPLLELELDSEYSLGGGFFLWEAATAVAGYHLGINPFDQPDVEDAKIKARKLLESIEKDSGGVGPHGDAIDIGGSAKLHLSPVACDLVKDIDGTSNKIKSILSKAKYVGVLLYSDPMNTKPINELRELREVIMKESGSATQFGYGPRYLHSTGQLHKGGSGECAFIIGVSRGKVDV
ncbi:MAG: hypothetical protein KAR06_03150, partial [Deltaproteobacteria bacterium]|nr:hypothetical protein [Deltaproteobacteria bacterium]